MIYAVCLLHLSGINSVLDADGKKHCRASVLFRFLFVQFCVGKHYLQIATFILQQADTYTRTHKLVEQSGR